MIEKQQESLAEAERIKRNKEDNAAK